MTLAQAICDTVLLNMASAKSWVFNPSIEPGSYLNICRDLGVNPEDLRKTLKEAVLIEKQCKTKLRIVHPSELRYNGTNEEDLNCNRISKA